MDTYEIKSIIDSDEYTDEEKVEALQDKGMELEDIFEFIMKNYR